MNTFIDVITEITTLGLPAVTAVVVTLMIRASKAHHKAVAVPAPKHVVNWQHVADLEKELFHRVYHHDSEWGAPVGSRVGSCCCAKCKRKRRISPVVKPVLERVPAVFPIPGVTFTPGTPPVGESVTRLRVERLRVWEQAKAAAEESINHYSPASREAFTMLMAALDDIDRRIAALHRVPGNDIYHAARERLPRVQYGHLSYIEVTAIGDREPKFIPADPQTQWQIDYDKGRREMRSHLGLEEEW